LNTKVTEFISLSEQIQGKIKPGTSSSSFDSKPSRKSMEVKEISSLGTEEIIATEIKSISSSISDLTSGIFYREFFSHFFPSGNIGPPRNPLFPFFSFRIPSVSHTFFFLSNPPSHVTMEDPQLRISEISDAELQYTNKRARHHFFHQQIQFISALLEASSILKRKGLRTKTENSKTNNSNL
jgi:hypothetical protein